MKEIQKLNKAEECVYSGSPSLVKISKEISSANCIAYVSILISDLVMNMNVGKQMNETQILKCSEAIIKEYYYLNLSEINFCFNNGLLGKYGKNYDRLDIQIIFEWLNKYTEERDEVVVKTNSNNKCEYEKKFNELILPVLKNVLEQKKEGPKIETQKAKPRYYDIHQKFMRLFDSLVKKFPADNTGRFLKRYNRIMDVEHFVNYKVEQLMKVNGILELRNKDIL